jgi:hypothetical protein
MLRGFRQNYQHQHEKHSAVWHPELALTQVGENVAGEIAQERNAFGGACATRRLRRRRVRVDS